jgi:putative transposase
MQNSTFWSRTMSSQPEPATSTQKVETSACRRMALHRLRGATERAHQALAQLQAYGLTDDGMLRRHRKVTKQGARVRGSSADTIDEVAEQIAALAQEYEVLLPENSSSGADAVSSPLLEGDGKEAKEKSDNSTLPALRKGESPGSAGETTERPLRLDEMPDRRLEEIARRHQLVTLMLNGMPTKRALTTLGIERTTSWARALRRRYERHGMRGLLDGRAKNSNPNRVMTPEVEAIIRKWWAARKAADGRAIWRAACKDCREQGLPEPGYDSVFKFLKKLSRAEQLFREGKEREWDKQGRPVVRVQWATYGNERWQLDHTQMDIWVREWVENHWELRSVFITAAVDAASRTVAGVVISTKQPDAWTTSILMMNAIEPKSHEKWLNRGLPGTVQPDRGKDFMSHSVASVMANLGVRMDPDPPYYPNRKGIVERFFLTLDSYLRILPGHKAAVGGRETSGQRELHVLLTRNQLQEVVIDWIANDYHTRPHEELEGKSPQEVWEQTVQLRMPKHEEELYALLLKSDRERIVQRTGVRFEHANYWSPELVDWWKREVRIRYNPEDLRSILLYDAATGQFICEAWVMGEDDSRYGIEDVKRTRSQFRRGLKERVRMYAKEVEEQDRKVAEREEWKVARKEAEEMARMPLPDPVAESEEAAIQRLLEQFERQDRGEW